jgi:hypothetical protein
MNSLRQYFKRILPLFVLLATVACAQSKIETDSLYNQLQLNEERNLEVVLKLTNTIETRGNRSEELTFLNKVTDLVNLKEKLALSSEQIKNTSSYNLQATKLYIDTLTARFQLTDSNEKLINLLSKTRVQLAEIDLENEDEYLHKMLQISYCETNLFTFYGSMVGVNELSWNDEDDYYEEKTFDLDSAATGLNFNAQGNYTTTKRKANELRASLAQAFLAATSPAQKEIILDSAQQLFTNYLLNEIIPYWYDTTWEFDGYTTVPKQGGIACGYFVSTTLKDMGVNVNKYKLAQQNPENESSTVAVENKNLKKYKFEEPGKSILMDLTTYKDGLYFVGLDYHVGYLYINNQQPYFIHSDYINGYVRIEPAKASQAFESYEYFISPISTNAIFLKKWLLQEELEVRRG